MKKKNGTFIKLFSVSIGLVILYWFIFSNLLLAQSLPVNLTYDEESHILKTEGKNTSSFYDEDILESVYLEFEQSDYWQQLHDSYDTENYVLGTLIYNGKVIDSIGAQFKGNTSYMNVSNNAKYSFAISLDEFVDGQDIEGYNTLNLNNAFEDPSFMKEVLYNHLNRYNIPSAKGNFIKLFINGEYWGIYNNIQQLNKDFTKEWFMTNNGSLWRGDASSSDDAQIEPPNGLPTGSPTGDLTGHPAGDSIGLLTRLPNDLLVEPPNGGGGGGGNNSQWGDGTTALNYLGADTTLYQEYYTLKHSSQDNPWDLLLKLTDVLNNTPDADLLVEISKYLDVDKTLWFLAHETVFVDDDSYIMKGRQDFYIYYEPETQLITPLEFDGNSTFDPRNIDWDMFYNEDNANFPLMNKLYAIPEIRQRYLAHARAIIDELLDVDLTNSLIEKYDALISNSVESDPKNMYSFTEYQATMTELKSFFGDRKSILESNSEVAETGLMIASVIHEVDDVEFASPNESEAVNVSANIDGTKNVSNVYLYYSTGIVGAFDKTEMFDDGVHNDGDAGDGFYGATIPGYASGEYVRYYIEAIADDAAKTASYSPVGAEHDVYLYRVNIANTVDSDVVINEVVASNSTIIADNEGEFDDWIELYNNSNEAVSLYGYFLSDDATNLTKWALPEVSIEANSYLVIWADNDEDQGAQHANFKLSSDGEELFLVTPNEEIADQIFFTSQASDISYGRLANGTGTFKSLTPTFSEENTEVVTSIISSTYSNNIDIKLYPNPANEYIIIEAEAEETMSFDIFDLQGRLMLTEKFNKNTLVDLTYLDKGLYMCKVESIDGIKVMPFIVE